MFEQKFENFQCCLLYLYLRQIFALTEDSVEVSLLLSRDFSASRSIALCGHRGLKYDPLRS